MAPSARDTQARQVRAVGRWLAVPAAAVLLGAMIAPSPAHAVMERRPADNAQHDYCLATGFNTAPGAAHTAMVNRLDGPTDMTHLFRGGCGSGPRGNSTVDVWFVETDIPTPDVRGQWFCQVPVQQPDGTFVCDTGDVRIDIAAIAAGGGPQPENREKTIVHEVGHSVGLADHSHNPCAMRQGALTNTETDLAHRQFAQADINLINNHY